MPATRVGGWDLLAADATDSAAFAAHVVALYRQEALWTHIRASVAARIGAEWGPEAFEQVVGEVWGDPIQTVQL